MYEVKVFDSSGNLKKVISIESLNKREKLQADNPSIFKRNKRFGRIAEKPAKNKNVSTFNKI
ncbi:MAG: hypothetical protein F3743_12710 [Nitrospinae bacterium]|nr:hypothetical protein [Nitrospinota bacterium]MZH14903.1 hypothetical protein [Nitrospinota bacterium]